MTQAASLRNIGLARALSKLGHCSRSRAAELILAGRVRLNGAIRRNPETPVHLEKDRIEIDHEYISSAGRVYLMLNKPRGVVTTASDEKGRKTVYDFFDKKDSWIAPVGRLDKASEGLLLFSNDSEWTARVLAPETHLAKTYHVQVGKWVDRSLVTAITNGVRTHKGDNLYAKSASVLRQGSRNTWLAIVLEEGKNRQIRRMFEHFALEVLRVVRVKIGPLALGILAKGAFRALISEEKLMLDCAMREAAEPRTVK